MNEDYIDLDEAEEAERQSRVLPEPPRPLTREPSPGEDFPIEALGDVLGNAARAITDRVQSPDAIAAQSVLAAATLATQGHANIELPIGERHTRPLSCFFATIGASGERKTTCDAEALWPIQKHEAALREKHSTDMPDYRNAKEAWEEARSKAKKTAKGGRAAIQAALEAIGPEPIRPLEPMLVFDEPSYEGLCKLFATGQPSLGLFTSEGGAFLGGYAMDKERILRCATGLSGLWDGTAIRRVRAGDGASVLVGRRMSTHLMLQPAVASLMFGNEILAGQGLLSRFLTAMPQSTIGTRLQRAEAPQTEPDLCRYCARILDVLEAPLPLTPGTCNELQPPPLRLTPGATTLSKNFADHIEKQCGDGGHLQSVRALANKIAEHAVRLAGVLALVDDIKAREITTPQLQCGITLGEFYLGEALQLDAEAKVDGPLKHARDLLRWLQQTRKPGHLVSLVDIYQRGPAAIRNQAAARSAVKILEDHGWLTRVPGGAIIGGVLRRDVWQLH